MAAVRLAMEEKADGVEFDIRRTRDGKAVVIHDDNAARTTGMNAVISDMLMDELQLVDAGCWKGPRWRGETVPELSTILKLLPKDMMAFIEIKCGMEILPLLKKVVPTAAARVLFVGFSLETMALVKYEFPHCTVFWNLELRKDVMGVWRPEVPEMIERVRNAGVDGVGLGYGEAIDGVRISQIHEAGLELFVWTVDDVEQAKALRSLNVDYLATNRPGWLRENLP